MKEERRFERWKDRWKEGSKEGRKKGRKEVGEEGRKKEANVGKIIGREKQEERKMEASDDV
jgi:hypothetical protein